MRGLALTFPPSVMTPDEWSAIEHALSGCSLEWVDSVSEAKDRLKERHDVLLSALRPDADVVTPIRLEQPLLPILLLVTAAQEWDALTLAGANTGVLCVLIADDQPDLTAARLAQALRQVMERARYAELESLAYTASHDLQAPIVSVRNFAHLLQQHSGLQLDERGRDYLNRIQANADFVGHLLRELLELSRVGKVENPDENLAVEQVVRQALADLALPLSERRVRLNLPKHWPIVRYSRARLRQIFFNLISNAIKFLGPQADPLLELGWRPLPQGVEFWVKDNGVGIHLDDQQRIFNPFQRLNVVDAAGTGVGLSIIKRIIEGRGGTLRVESAPQHGATFLFTIPNAETATIKPISVSSLAS